MESEEERDFNVGSLELKGGKGLTEKSDPSIFEKGVSVVVQGYHSQLTKSIKPLWVKYSLLIKIQRITIFLIY